MTVVIEKFNCIQLVLCTVKIQRKLTYFNKLRQQNSNLYIHSQ